MITAAEARILYQTALNKEAETILEKLDALIRRASANKTSAISWHNNELNSVIIEKLKQNGYTLIQNGNYTIIEWPTK